MVAAPQSDCRKARRPSPTRFACSPIRRSASLLARATCSVSGTGRNSPLEVELTLIGSGPLTSSTMTSCLSVVAQSLDQFRASWDYGKRRIAEERAVPNRYLKHAHAWQFEFRRWRMFRDATPSLGHLCRLMARKQ